MTKATLSMVALVFASASAEAVPAAFHMELRGLEVEARQVEEPVDHSRVSMISALQVKAAEATAAKPVMAVLIQAGAAGKTAVEDVEIRFVGMRFVPSEVTITEGVHLRLLNESPVAMELVPRGKKGKPMRVEAGQSIRFAPGSTEVHRYGAQRWASASLRVDVAPKGRLVPLTTIGGIHRFELANLKEGPARMRIQIGDRWEPIPEFILRQNNVLKMVVSYEAEGKGGERKLRVAERREVPVELSESENPGKVKKRKKRRRPRRRRRRR